MIYTNSDGGARGNPGPGAVAALVRKEGEIITKYSKFIGENTTNNVAEYEGLILALELASNITKDEITCFLDSELVVKQLLGECHSSTCSHTATTFSSAASSPSRSAHLARFLRPRGGRFASSSAML